MSKPAAQAPIELVYLALASGDGNPIVVTKRDGIRLEKTGRWKITGKAEAPVLETKLDAFAMPAAPVTETASATHTVVVDIPAPVKPSVSWSKFGEDHED